MNYPEDFINKIIRGDCLDVMPHIPDKSIDMILCDLPYGVTARNKWDIIIPFEPLWKEYKRIIKDSGIIVLTATEPFSSMLVMSNKEMFRYDLIWEKPLATGFLNANRMPLRSHEQILVFYKKLPTYNPQKTDGKLYTMKQFSYQSENYNKRRFEKVITENKDGKRYPKSVQKFSWDKDKLHPTQKPLAMFEWLIKTYTNKNEIILDNCIGSGTTAIACKNTNRNFIGIEKNEKYYHIANQRVVNLITQMSLIP